MSLLASVGSLTGELNSLVAVAISLTMGAAGGVIFFTRLRRGALVYTHTRRENLSFLRRNNDAIVVGTAIALVGAGAGAVLTWLLTR